LLKFYVKKDKVLLIDCEHTSVTICL